MPPKHGGTPRRTPQRARGSGAVEDDSPKVKYAARDPSAGYLAATPEVPKLDRAGFSVWKGNFLLHLQRTLQHMRFLELKSIIEETEVGQGHPAVPAVVTKDDSGAEVTTLGNPREMVTEYGQKIVDALRTSVEMQLRIWKRRRKTIWHRSNGSEAQSMCVGLKTNSTNWLLFEGNWKASLRWRWSRKIL